MIEDATEVSVVIVDDHALIRQGVRAFLETQTGIKVIGEASSGQEALDICAGLTPNVVLMDLLMPGMDGIECTRLLKRQCPDVQVVILSSYHEDEQIIPAMRAGAISYLLKDIGPVEMVDAVRKAAAGQIVLSSQVASHILKALAGSPVSDDPLGSLSDRELEILKLIADGQSNAAIADTLFISEKTVKSHVRSILAKLQLTDRTQAAAYAWRSGLVHRTP